MFLEEAIGDSSIGSGRYPFCTQTVQAKERAMIGRYATENGPTRTSKYFLKLLRKNVSEPTDRRFKKEYLLKLKELLKEKHHP